MSTDSPTPVEFVLTADRIRAISLAYLIGSSLSLFLCTFACLASALIYSVPSARKHLDRVSFRLFLWSMVVEVVYDLCFLVGTNDHTIFTRHNDCGTLVYFLLSAMGSANWLCTAIGVNLLLAITFGINPIRAKLERWYIGLSLLLGIGVPLVPAILSHFGLDPIYNLCYFTQGNRELRTRDFIVDLYLWQLLSCLVAAASIITVLITLFRQSRATKRTLSQGHKVTITSADIRDMNGAPTYTNPGLQNRPLLSHRSQLNRLQDRLTTIALKISLYPLALLLINTIITAEDLSYTSRGGIFNEVQYGMFFLHNTLYASRGIFFALIGMFVDPCIRLGLPAARKAWTTSYLIPPSFRQEQPHIDDDWSEQSMADFLSTSEPEDADKAYPLLVALGGRKLSSGRGLEEKGIGTQLEVSIAPSMTYEPVSPPPIAVTRRQQDWLDPLANAVLAQSSSKSDDRRSSEPVLGVAQRRRMDLQLAAEEMYTQARMRL